MKWFMYAGTTYVSITQIPLEILLNLEGCYKVPEINSYKDGLYYI